MNHRHSIDQIALGLFAASCFLIPTARADLAVGLLSYDTFIPVGNDSPAVDAFDVFNLTGPFNLAPDFPVTEPVTFQSAVLTLTLDDSSQEVLSLGDIAPGPLLDGNGNPVAQVSDDERFVSAELTAKLSPTVFTLFDGSIFAANSDVIDVLLTPPSGTLLEPDVSQATISAVGTVNTVTPEPSYTGLVAAGLLLTVWAQRRTDRRPL